MGKKKKIIRNSIYILFILLPIIDCLRRTFIKDINIFGFSIIEFIYMFIIGYSLILTVMCFKDKWKELKYLIIYSILLFIYIFIHDIHILGFNVDIFRDANVNIITESYYILRVYYMPVLLLFILVKNKDIFDIKFYSKVLKSVICIISLSIVLLNIFKLSYATYSAENLEFVKYNIFDFYKSSESPKLLSTRGWFDSANEISAILMMLLPLNIYLLFKDRKKSNILLYAIQFIAMIILGTRVSSLGAIIISICAIIINIISRLFKQSKINYKFIICSLLCTGYFFISPVGTYLLKYTTPNYNSNDEHSEYLKNINDKEDITEYITDHLYDLRINEAFIELYPIENDFSFWYEIALGNRNSNNDSRVMKTRIIKRVKERNNNKYDTLLGMGYTINFQDLERDYVYQYYIFGILGIILILPQIILFIKNGLLLVKNIKNIKNINIINVLLCMMACCLGFFVAYFSGHVFGWISPSYVLVLVIAILNYIYFKEMKEYEKK